MALGSKEGKALRSELARQGTDTVLPLLRAIEPKIRKLDLTHFPISKLNPRTEITIETRCRERVVNILDNAMELVREVGSKAEAPLILALGVPGLTSGFNRSSADAAAPLGQVLGVSSLYVRSQAAAFLGIAAVRSGDCVPFLREVASNNDEHIAIRLAAANSLMISDYTDQETWNAMAHFLKSWADKTILSWESDAKKKGIAAQDAISTWVHRMVLHLLIVDLTR